MKRRLLLVLFFVLLIASCSREATMRRIEEELQAPSGSSAPLTVIRETGRSDQVTDDFVISGSCANGRLEYSGSQIDSDVDSAWVNFRVYDVDISEYSLETSGPHDLIPTGSGSTRVSLDAGTYYVEVENYNSEWEFSIVCR